MQIWKTDGTRKVYIFEDGSEVPFTDKKGYMKKKNAPSPGQENLTIEEPYRSALVTVLGQVGRNHHDALLSKRFDEAVATFRFAGAARPEDALHAGHLRPLFFGLLAIRVA